MRRVIHGILPTAGQVHEATQASTHPRADAHQLIADKGFDADSFRDELTAGEVDAVIPPMTHRNGLLR
jgi:IS5 family transposase